MPNRPVILIGNGCRHNPELIKRLCDFGVPVLTTWMGMDLLPDDEPVYCGRPGARGMRGANIILQKATHLYVYGARLDLPSVAFSYDNLAPNARHIMVFDVDRAELRKFDPTPWLKSRWSFMDFDLQEEDVLLGIATDIVPDWLPWAKALHTRYDTLDLTRPEHRFIQHIHDTTDSDTIIGLGSSGLAAELFVQSYPVKRGQRVINLSTIGAMGADVPMAIGEAIGTGRRVVCITGDGSFMLNVNALPNAVGLPIDFYVLTNGGYASIATMQDRRFAGRHVACDVASGLPMPDVAKVAESMGVTIHTVDATGWKIEPYCAGYFNAEGKLVSPALENMTPLLDPKELQELMEW